MNFPLLVTISVGFFSIPCATLAVQLLPHLQYAPGFQYQSHHTLMYSRGILVPPSSKAPKLVIVVNQLDTASSLFSP